ncbi:MAG: OmpA family protein [Reichenbachiella sp.]
MFIIQRLKIISLTILFLCGFMAVQAQDTTDKTKKKGVDIIITQSPKIFIQLEKTIDNSCNGESKGSIGISADGGYPPYKYYWSNGATSQDVAGLEAGTYQVAVYDGFSCSDTLSITIKEPEKLQTEVVQIKDIICFGYNQGKIDIEVKGGLQPYKYSWSNGSTAQDLEGVISGQYSVLITDANNCQEIVTATIKETPLIVRSIDDVKNILCNGDPTGEIEISVEGGHPPYAYSWNNGATTQDINNIVAGNYEVTVTDSEGCSEVSTAKVVEPELLTVEFDRVRNVRCFADESGTIDIKVEGGVTPFVYTWNNGATTQDIAGVGSGSYSVEVVDINGCKNGLATEITQPTNLDVKMIMSNDVSFHGGSDGKIEISVEGGSAPYKYKWNNSATTQNIESLAFGNYNVRVSDASGCSKIVNVTIDQPSELTAKVDLVTDIKCNGDESGEINISVRGGVEPYTYLWNNGATTEDLTAIGAEKYNVIITDANKFEFRLDTIVTEPTKFVAEISNVDNILCNGDIKGTIDLEVTGGIAPYKYHWSNGMITQDLEDVAAGTYSVKIMDANRCELSLEATISQPDELIVGFGEITNILCYDQSTGAIAIEVSGGVEPYAYTWSNGATTQNLSNIKSGNYEVTVIDKNGCNKSINTKITEPELLLVREGKIDNVDCFGNTTGQINLNITGGVTPYIFAWNTGDSSQNITQLAAGKYSLQITDANGCATSYSKLLTSPPKLKSAVASVVDNICNGDRQGELNIDVSGGIKPYRYRWNTGTTSQDIVDVKSGAYSLEIIDSNGCKDSVNAVIKEPELLTATVDIVHILCHGDKSGTINLSVAGGKAPYSYKWSNGATTQDIASLKTGQYSVVITDANGCTNIQDITIEQPTRFIAILESENNIKCYGQNTGAINIKAVGGIQPYEFIWNTGETTKDIGNIPAGAYNLKAVDANGCTQLVSTKINQPSEVKYSVDNVTNVDCYGEEQGAIDISIIGGVGPYKYSWSNGATTQDLINVLAGQYAVQIEEGNGCINTIDVNITQPTLLALRLDTVGHILCNGDNTGLINVSVKGGTAPYKYSWSNGKQTEDISSLVAGRYTITITDAKGCTKTASTNVKQPQPFIASILNVDHIKCSGETTGNIAINVLGGVRPYVFQWNNGANTQNLTKLSAGLYKVKITDSNGCIQEINQEITEPVKLTSQLVSMNDVSCAAGSDGSINITVNGGTTPYLYSWSNGAQTQDISDVMAGDYSVVITDKNGCRDSSIVVNIKEPTKLIANIAKTTHIKTHGYKTGAIDLTVTGGVPVYKFSWSNGASAQNIKDVPAGNYSVNVIDSKGCEVILKTIVRQPPALKVLITSITDIKCFGDSTGAINVSVTGGVKPYTFAWSHGDSTQSVSSITAGDYALTVIDANGHKQVVTTNVAEPIDMNVKVDNINHVLCYSAQTGSIALTVTGGVAPYSYIWSNGATTQDLENIPAGDYEVTVTNKNGCQKVVPIKVNEPEDLLVKVVNVDNIKCNGDNEGGVRIEITGGEQPYRYNWSNGEKTQNISNVIAGNYNVVITDANGCIEYLDASIVEPSKLVASINEVVHNNCFGEKIGSIATLVSGGVGQYSYQWNTGDSTQSISNLAIGQYDVIVRDSVGCEQNLNTEITQPEELLVSITDQVNINCFGDTDASLDIDIVGGTTPYLYNWSNGATTKNLSDIPAGTFSLEVTDGKNCTEEIHTEVTQPATLALRLDTLQHNLCNGDDKGLVDITVSGGVTPYEYSWNNGDHSADLVNVIAGNYVVKVKDANNCKQTLNADVQEPEVILAVIDQVTDVNCNGDETGAMTTTISGGIAPYSYLWSNGSTSSALSSVLAGEYELSVTDSNGCIAKVEAEISEPAKFVNTVDAITDIQCFGELSGAIYVTALEGVAPYQFEWSNGETTEDISSLSAGHYELKITEANDCISYLEADIEQPPMFDTQLTNVADVNCYGDETGAISISAGGGVEPYTFTWSNGNETQNIENVIADNYSVMITDANGCLNTINAIINQPEELALNIDSVNNVKCCGDQSGAIYISVNGGTEPYEYLWSNGATSQDIENLILGRYTVNVTDAAGCEINSLESDELNLYEQVVTTGKFITRNIEFDVGKSTIKAESFRIVNKIATLMKEHPDLIFRIEGHTDSDGTMDANQNLSEARSESIKAALIKFGIAETRLYTKGWGESKPIASNTTSAGKKQNRRVEFVSLTGTLTGEMIDNNGI